MNKASLILFIIAGFFFLVQMAKFASLIAAVRAGQGRGGSVSLVFGYVALTCAIVGVVLK